MRWLGQVKQYMFELGQRIIHTGRLCLGVLSMPIHRVSRDAIRVAIYIDKRMWEQEAQVLADLLTGGSRSALVRRLIKEEMIRQVKGGGIKTSRKGYAGQFLRG